ncbi:MAG TPA: triose-phosphate isomerase family protein [Propionibacteriaceae bacterium]|jgi:triosephosphate isomerase|nr:triose-phosphate isomerase family protein [Propionibacteriaceae bacterium]
MSITIGVSLKAYLGYRDTLRWASEVAGIARSRSNSSIELFVLPAFPALVPVRDILTGSGIAVGSQDIAADDAGNQTGEVTGAMLADIGCRYAEVGHAERRRHFCESEQVVAAKTAAALRHRLVPVICLGEPTRLDLDAAVEESVRQLRHALGVGVQPVTSGGRVVVAYEPHWAIGAAEPAPDEHIVAVVAGLRQAASQLAPGSSVIYGGSAGPGLLTRLAGGVDGLFLGRFAHDPKAFATVLDEAIAIQLKTAAS